MYFANVLDAALAITAFAKFCIAVMASISCSTVGGNRIFSFRSGSIVFHGGNCKDINERGRLNNMIFRVLK